MTVSSGPKSAGARFTTNCPINECTGDGRYVGRCWFHCPDEICPRHGNVSVALAFYRETGKLTKEDPTWLRQSTEGR